MARKKSLADASPLPEHDPWLGKPQVAELLAISVRTVERLVGLGQLPKPVILGKQWRWRRSRLLTHLGQLEAAAQR